jgi:hypothetical protein
MAFVIADRIKETSTTTGTGTFTLAGAVTGFGTFQSIGNSNTTTYLIVAVDANGVPTGEWETGIGTYTSSGTTLSRGFIASSTGSAVSFAAGTKHVICTDVARYATPLVMATTANRAIQVADQTALSATAGNARGQAAVDLQIKRSSATQVASGSYSFAAGKNNTASGLYGSFAAGSGNVASGHSSFAMGISNTASGSNSAVLGGTGNSAAATNSVAIGGSANNVISGTSGAIFGGSGNTASAGRATCLGGLNNTASSGYSTCLGGSSNTASSSHSTCVGGQLNTASANYAAVCIGGFAQQAYGRNAVTIGRESKANKFSQFAQSSGKMSVTGDAQRSAFVLRKQTTNTTASEVFIDNSSARLTMENDTTWAFDGLIIARRTDADGTNSGWSFSGVIKRDTNAASTALVGTCVPVVIMQDAGAALTAVTVTADTTNGSLKFTVTGETSKTYNWVVYLRTVEVTG